MQHTVLSIGECMVELTESSPGTLRKGFSGDTFNTAYYLRRALPDSWEVEYLSALGTDALSEEMLAFMASNRVGTRYVVRHKDRLPGVYMVHLKNGERSFSYWRSEAAARELAADFDHLSRAIDHADVVFFSGITIAIVNADDRQKLFSALTHAKRRGCEVVFDPNIRLRLWADMNEARKIITEAARCATTVMPSFEDEALCFGDASPEVTIARYRELGSEHVVVKNGSAGATIYRLGTTCFVPAVPVEEVIDTTSAGDSFNGTYIARLIHGDLPEKAGRFASQVASVVIGQRGAIVPHVL